MSTQTVWCGRFSEVPGLAQLDPKEVERVRELAQQPRRVLGYRMPAEVFYEALGVVGKKNSIISDLCSRRE